MATDQKHFDLLVERGPTILVKVIQVITRRRVPIHSLLATRYPGDPTRGRIKIVLETDDERARLVLQQLKKLVDVLEIANTTEQPAPFKRLY